MPSRRAKQSLSPTPRLVVDVGNTRIKWGLVSDTAVLQSTSLPPDETIAWNNQLDFWKLTGPVHWALSGVHPQRLDRFADWVWRRGDQVEQLCLPKQLPIKVAVPRPGMVGVDRLLNAVAVNTRRTPHAPAFIVDAGTAITVDFVDQDGAFRGGAIMPGLSLMARALHDYTAKLPLIEVTGKVEMPGNSTVQAMNAGIFSAALGGIRYLTEKAMKRQANDRPVQVFLGGGDAMLLSHHLGDSTCVWPLMTLEGLRLAAWPTP